MGSNKEVMVRSPGERRCAKKAAKSLLTISQGSRSGLCGMGCKARCAVDSPAIHKRRNAADRPQRPLPEGLERNRVIGRRSCLHGHEPMRRIRSIHSSRLRSNAIPCEIANRLLELNAAAQNVQHTGVNKGSGFVLTPCCPGGASGAGAVA